MRSIDAKSFARSCSKNVTASLECTELDPATIHRKSSVSTRERKEVSGSYLRWGHVWYGLMRPNGFQLFQAPV